MKAPVAFPSTLEPNRWYLVDRVTRVAIYGPFERGVYAMDYQSGTTDQAHKNAKVLIGDVECNDVRVQS